MANDSTSLQAFFKEKTQRDISTLETRVLDSLYVDGPATRLDLSNRLDKPINYITAPVLNLIKAGIIEEHDRIVQPETGNKAWQLKVKEKYAWGESKAPRGSASTVGTTVLGECTAPPTSPTRNGEPHE